MKYFLDTEFNGAGGELISLALVSETDREMYLAAKCERPDPWVEKNVLPIIECDGAKPYVCDRSLFGPLIAWYLHTDSAPVIVSDWPDDIKYLCGAIVTGPGEMADIPRLSFELARVDAYPTALMDAVQHNALWDARALKLKLTERRSLPPGVHQS